jgi:hypothetical protein
MNFLSLFSSINYFTHLGSGFFPLLQLDWLLLHGMSQASRGTFPESLGWDGNAESVGRVGEGVFFIIFLPTGGGREYEHFSCLCAFQVAFQTSWCLAVWVIRPTDPTSLWRNISRSLRGCISKYFTLLVRNDRCQVKKCSSPRIEVRHRSTQTLQTLDFLTVMLTGRIDRHIWKEINGTNDHTVYVEYIWSLATSQNPKI